MTPATTESDCGTHRFLNLPTKLRLEVCGYLCLPVMRKLPVDNANLFYGIVDTSILMVRKLTGKEAT